MTESVLVSRRLGRWGGASLVVGAIGIAGCAMGMREGRGAFFESYLYAWMFWLGISLGGSALVMLHNLTGGEWGVVVRRVGEAGRWTLPLMVVLFLPILGGMRELFVWARPEAVAGDELLRHREIYLNVPFFMVRAGVYFGIWILLGFGLARAARVLKREDSDGARRSLRGWSAVGLIVYMVTMTHAGVDWAMSREVHFYSTAFGFVVTVGQTLSALAFAIVILPVITERREREGSIKPGVFNDVGNVLLTLVILWAYVSFMEFLVIWMGNLREDNGHFVKRGLSEMGVWRWVGLGLIVLHFFVPFFLLLFRATKRYLRTLFFVAAVVLGAHLVEQYWLIVASGEKGGAGFHLSWMDFVTPAAIGGLWLGVFFWALPRGRDILVGEVAEREGGGHE